ncbi:MAG: hypothetical protein DWQ02_08455 [Bacteroidetes bacterium]|nr:MAG: hypothetical protein DWQ02_08455 [Bacteroidota bacterium]
MGQSHYSISGKSIQELKSPITASLKISSKKFVFPSITPVSELQEFPSLKQKLLAPYSVKDLAFFCRLEVKLEKKIGLPFKFRLGEVQYTERMEGKY